MTENSVFQIQESVNTQLLQAIDIGILDRRRGEQLITHLSRLAFNMVLNGKTSVEKPLANVWLFRIRTRKRHIQPRPTIEEVTEAAWVWQGATSMDLLIEKEGKVRFSHLSLQNYFCTTYCQSQLIDSRTLRLTANDRFRDVWRWRSLLDIGIVDQLIELISALPQNRTLAYAVRVLGYLHDPKASELITQLSLSPSASVRLQCCIALEEIVDQRAIESLIERLFDSIREVRWRASKALGKIGFPAIPALVDTLAQADNERRWRAGQALKYIGESAVEPLITVLGNSNEMARLNAAFVLGWIKDERTVQPLLNALSDTNPGVRAFAAKALGTQGSAAAVGSGDILTDT